MCIMSIVECYIVGDYLQAGDIAADLTITVDILARFAHYSTFTIIPSR